MVSEILPNISREDICSGFQVFVNEVPRRLLSLHLSFKDQNVRSRTLLIMDEVF
jgi:hypothetical protein